MRPDDASPWIRTVRPEARLRLVCLPHAGGGSLPYRGWAERLPHVDVCPVVLPGREGRLSEPARADLAALVRELADALGPVLDHAPYALFGHSMGAWLAFELAREQRRRGASLPVHLFASARRAPGLPDPFEPVHHLSDDDFVRAVQDRYRAIPERMLERPAFLRMFLPALRADFALLETWSYAEEAPLPVPITCVRGADDATVSRDEILAWRALTTDDFAVATVPGGHFFLEPERDRVVEIVDDALP